MYKHAKHLLIGATVVALFIGGLVAVFAGVGEAVAYVTAAFGGNPVHWALPGVKHPASRFNIGFGFLATVTLTAGTAFMIGSFLTSVGRWAAASLRLNKK